MLRMFFLRHLRKLFRFAWRLIQAGGVLRRVLPQVEPLEGRVLLSGGPPGMPGMPGMPGQNPWPLNAQVRSTDPQQGYLQTVGEATVDLNEGGLRLGQPLDLDQSDSARASAAYALYYNSMTTDQPLVVEATLQSDPTAGVPTGIVGTLTVDGTAHSPVTFATTGHLPGDSYLLALQAPVSGTGLHSWQLNLQINLANGTNFTESTSGTAAVVDRQSLRQRPRRRLGAGRARPVGGHSHHPSRRRPDHPDDHGRRRRRRRRPDLQRRPGHLHAARPAGDGDRLHRHAHMAQPDDHDRHHHRPGQRPVQRRRQLHLCHAR
jgi:hypothetical protein